MTREKDTMDMLSVTQDEGQEKDTNLQEYLRSEQEAEETFKAMMEKDTPAIWDEINRRLDAAASEQEPADGEKSGTTEAYFTRPAD